MLIKPICSKAQVHVEANGFAVLVLRIHHLETGIIQHPIPAAEGDWKWLEDPKHSKCNIKALPIHKNLLSAPPCSLLHTTSDTKAPQKWF